jgi:hypothetical protein
MIIPDHMVAINKRVVDGGVKWRHCPCGRLWPFPAIGLTEGDFQCQVCVTAELAKGQRRLATALAYAQEVFNVPMPNHESSDPAQDAHEDGRGSE